MHTTTPVGISRLFDIPAESDDDRQRLITMVLDDARRFDDPFLVVIIYASEWVRAEFEKTVQFEIEKRGWPVDQIAIREQDEADIPTRLREDLDKDKKVFFVSGFQAGAPRSYQALNFRREFFFDHKLRAVLWATEGEARLMIEQAPDFWQIPNLVIELLDQPPQGSILEEEVALKDEEYYWPQLGIEAELLLNLQVTQQHIEGRLELLSNLEKRGDKTVYERAKLSYTIGALYWASEQLGPADKLLGNAQHLAEDIASDTALSLRSDDPIVALGREFLAAIVSGRGNVALRRGYFSLAEEFFREVVIRLDDASGWLGLGHLWRVQKNTVEAARCYQAVLGKLAPKLNRHLGWRAYFGLGQIYFVRRELELALQMFEEAYKLGMSNLPLLGMADALRELGRHNEALESYEKLENTIYHDEATQGRKLISLARKDSYV